MADLSDVYGNNFHSESYKSRVQYILNNIAKNFCHRNFKFRMANSHEIWQEGKTLPKESIDYLIRKIKMGNPKMDIKHIDKNSDKINMLPLLIVDTPVEYFLIIDGEYNRAYTTYITPGEAGAF